MSVTQVENHMQMILLSMGVKLDKDEFDSAAHEQNQMKMIF